MEVIKMRKYGSFETFIFIILFVIGGGLTFAYFRVTENLLTVYV